MSDTNNPWQIVDEEIVYTNNWITVHHYNVINPNGGRGVYGKVHFKNVAVGIVAINEQEEIILVGQYRFPLKAYSWEIPEGGATANEPPLLAAQLELLEETGLHAATWSCLLKNFHLSNSVTDEYGFVFCASNLTQHKPQPEDTELLQTKWLPITEVFAMVENGNITDSLSVVALQRMQILLLQKQLNITNDIV